MQLRAQRAEPTPGAIAGGRDRAGGRGTGRRLAEAGAAQAAAEARRGGDANLARLVEEVERLRLQQGAAGSSPSAAAGQQQQQQQQPTPGHYGHATPASGGGLTPSTPASNRPSTLGGLVGRDSEMSSDYLPTTAHALDSLAVAVPACTRAKDGGGYWSYCVSVSCAGVQYVVLKRFSDFRAAHARYVAGGFASRVGLFPSLPPRRSFSTQDERFAERRRGELEQYLAGLVAEPEMRSCAELHAFLELGLILRRSRAG